MNKRTIFFRVIAAIVGLTASSAHAAVAANDLILTQRNAANDNNTTRYVTATANRVLQFSAASPAVPGIGVLAANPTTGNLSGFTTGAGVTLHGGGTVTGASGAVTVQPSSAALTLGGTAIVATAPLAAFNVAAGITPFVEFEVDSTSTSSPRGIMTAQFNTGTDGARFHMRKARGTRASPTVVVTGDNLGRLVASGYDGSNYLEMGSILFGSEGTIASTRVPTNIQFYTATNAAPSVLTEAVRVDSSQRMGIGTTVPSQLLHVNKLSVGGTIGTNVLAWIGNGSGNSGDLSQVGFGYYNSTVGTKPSTIIGEVATSGSGVTKGAFFVATRDVTTDTAPTERMRVTAAGNVLIGTSTEGSELLQVAGAGTFSGAVTIGGGSAITKVLTATATLNFGTILAAANEDLTITVTGAAAGDTVAFGLPATVAAGAIFNAWVSSANTVTVRCNNAGAVSIDPASATYRAEVIQH